MYWVRIINTKRKAEVIEMLCSCDGMCGIDNYFNVLHNIGEELQFKDEIIKLSNFGTALGSIERLIILNSLEKKDRCVCELEAILDKTQSTISHHLRKLERAELITGYKQGNFTYYSRNNEKLDNYFKLLKSELAI